MSRSQKVLIVAKCNVNKFLPEDNLKKLLVLKVAKCNVNNKYISYDKEAGWVLIVAKCNVNICSKKLY